jgi:predicted PurR-regulated permease PerM
LNSTQEQISEAERQFTARLFKKFVIHTYGRISSAILASLGVVHALYFARAILIPMALAFVLFFLLAPVVRFLSCLRLVNESIAAAVVVLALSAMIRFASYFLAGPFSHWIVDAPATFRNTEHKLRFLTDPVDKIDQDSEQVSKILRGRKKMM